MSSGLFSPSIANIVQKNILNEQSNQSVVTHCDVPQDAHDQCSLQEDSDNETELSVDEQGLFYIPTESDVELQHNVWHFIDPNLILDEVIFNDHDDLDQFYFQWRIVHEARVSVENCFRRKQFNSVQNVIFTYFLIFLNLNK